MPSPIVYDLTARILELFSADYDLLSRCALVSWEFNRAASRLLYARVVVAPKLSLTLDLSDTTGVPRNTNFLSARLPRNAPHVLSLEIKGYTSQRPPGPRNTLSATLAEAIPLFVNLKRVYFAPAIYQEDLFLPVLPELVKLQNRLLGRSTEAEQDQAPTNSSEIPLTQSSAPPDSDNAPTSPSPSPKLASISNIKSSSSSGITDLTVNPSCMTIKPIPSDAEEDYVETGTALSLVQLEGLRKLTLISPGRAILASLPDWLGRLQTTLVELHLKDNCGSITPGVLRSLLPYIKDKVQAFTLGLSYSLTDDDVFGFLSELPHLRRVNLRYYWQMRAPTHQRPVPTLRSFTATYPMLATSKEVRDFGKWVRRALAGTERLEVLRLRREGDGTGSSTLDEEDEDGYNDETGGGIDFFGRTVHSFLTGSDEGRVRARSKEGAADGDDANAEGQAEGPQTAGTRQTTENDADDDRPPPSHRVAHTGLVDHILQKHARTIRILDLGEALVSVRHLRQIIESCDRLEELRCVLCKQALAVFTEALQQPSSSPTSCALPRLRKVSFELSDVKHSTRSDVLGLMARKLLVRVGDEPVHPSLRRVQLNSFKWEATFGMDHRTNSSKFMAYRTRDSIPPWERKSTK